MSQVPMATPTAPGGKPLRPELSGDEPQLGTLAVHAGEARQKPGDAITDAIFCASTYTFADTQSVIDYIEQ
jgi:hypothetical protein